MLVDYNIILVSCLQRMDDFVQLSKSNRWCPSKSNTSLAFRAPLLQLGEDLTQKCFQSTPCTKFCISFMNGSLHKSSTAHYTLSRV